jgi:uncharacterized protein YndB with AHSA1/START domain
MPDVTVSTVISAPREAVFDLVADLSARPAFTDHYMRDFRLARANPCGRGAAARFLLGRRIFKDYVETSISECERPTRIVEKGRVGRRGRSGLDTAYEFAEEQGGTRVQMTVTSEPKTAVDRMRQRGLPGWIKRQSGRALERLRGIFEDPQDGALQRVTVAASEPHTAPRFGGHVTVPGKAAAGER